MTPNLIGIYVGKSGKIEVHKDMSRDDMWTVLEWAFSEIVRQRGRITEIESAEEIAKKL